MDPISYGGVSLNHQESQAFLLHPKIRVYEEINIQTVEQEAKKGLAKIHWEDNKSNGKPTSHQEPTNTHANIPFR